MRARSLLAIFTSYPGFVIGIMLLLTSLELGRVAFKKVEETEVLVLLFTALISAAFNITFGFIADILIYFTLERKLIKM